MESKMRVHYKHELVVAVYGNVRTVPKTCTCATRKVDTLRTGDADLRF